MIFRPSLSGLWAASPGPLDPDALAHAERATTMTAAATRQVSNYFQMLKGEAGPWEQLDASVWDDVEAVYLFMGAYQLLPELATSNYTTILDALGDYDLTATNLHAADRQTRFDGTGFAVAASRVIDSSPLCIIAVMCNQYANTSAEAAMAENSGAGAAGRSTFINWNANDNGLRSFFNDGVGGHSSQEANTDASETSSEPRMIVVRNDGSNAAGGLAIYVDGEDTPKGLTAIGYVYTPQDTPLRFGGLGNNGNQITAAMMAYTIVTANVSATEAGKIARNTNRIFQLGCKGTGTLRRMPNASYTSEVRLVPPGASSGPRFLGSPCLLHLANGEWLASSDDFGSGTTVSVGHIHASDDDGDSWEIRKADQSAMFWGTLFLDGGNPHCLCASAENGELRVKKSTDSGATWSNVKISVGTNGIDDANWHKAPTAFVDSAGWRWFCVERVDMSGPNVVGDNRPRWLRVIGYQLGSDPTDPASWASSNEIDVGDVRGFIPGAGVAHEMLEGNLCVRPDGTVGVWYRLTTALSYGAAYFEFDPSIVQLTFVENQPTAEFGQDKFHMAAVDGGILAIGNLYQTLVNNDRTRLCAWFSATGDDDWVQLDTDGVLPDLGARNYLEEGVMYPYFIIEDGIIYMVVRCAWNGAARYHDSNRMLFWRIPLTDLLP